MQLIAYCGNCKTNWKVGQDVELPPDIVVPISIVTLEALTVKCPTGICEGREIPVTAIDLNAENPVIGSSPQDGSGRPIKKGDVIRYRGLEYRIQRTVLGDSMIKLEGYDDAVKEWSVDLVERA